MGKRSDLLQVQEEDNVKKVKKSSSSKKDVSPMLSQWAKATSPNEIRTVKSEVKKTKKLSDRRTKQMQRREEENIRNSQEVKLLKELVELAESTNVDVKALLSVVDSLVENGSTTMNGKEEKNYRLLWVGSDDSICHVGTSLHNVPLARLQEIFLTLTNRNVELYEVIRILGPFPNVKNTLRGTVSKSKFTYTSMIDGTGKEILADEDKQVPLDILLATDNVLIWRVPNKDSEDGKDLLVFLREFDMDTRLEALRVA